MKTCIFCRIIAGELPKKLVREWDDAIAIVPLNPVTDGHVLVLPKQHVADFAERPEITAAVCRRAAELQQERWGSTSPEVASANLITSMGAEATQTVFHLHVHLVPRRAGDGLPLPWTPQQEAERNTRIKSIIPGGA